MRRITILLAVLAALMLVPAAQAFALGTLTSTSKAEGGSGEANSVEGATKEGYYFGNPPIECNYEAPGPAAGVCESEMTTAEGSSTEAVDLIAVQTPAPKLRGGPSNLAKKRSVTVTTSNSILTKN